jgi:hypothetical protein
VSTEIWGRTGYARAAFIGMRIQEGVNDWREVATDLRPKQGMLSKSHQFRGNGCRARRQQSLT